MWLFLQTQTLQQKRSRSLFNIEQIKVNWFFFDHLIIFFYIVKVHLENNLPVNIIERINRATQFYQRTSQRNNIYCKQLELIDSSWDTFIQRTFISIDHFND